VEVGWANSQHRPTPRLPDYTKVDLHAGAKYDLWAVNLYVNNVTDRRAALYAASVGSRIRVQLHPATDVDYPS